MNPNRRSFLIGLSTVLAAPAIVRAASLMPVKPAAGYFAIEEMPTNYALWSGAGLEIDFTVNVTRCPVSRRVLGTAMELFSYDATSQLEHGKGLLVRDVTALRL